MDLHDEQKENIRKERYYESLIGKDYAKGKGSTDRRWFKFWRSWSGPRFQFCRSKIFKILLTLIRPGIPAKGLDLIWSCLHSDGPCPDWYGARPKFEIQKTVLISKKMQSHLKNHFGDAWKQKTMAYFISNRINPIFGTVEKKIQKFSRKIQKTLKN